MSAVRACEDAIEYIEHLIQITDPKAFDKVDDCILNDQNDSEPERWNEMSSKKQKLELTWLAKENRPRLEPRILLEDLAQSHQGKKRGQPFRITRSQLREVGIHIGFSASKIKPYFNTI